jgi:hypothetical protein
MRSSNKYTGEALEVVINIKREGIGVVISVVGEVYRYKQGWWK